MPERKYFSANTLEQAILQAARHYSIRPEDLAYEPIEKRHGFIRNRKRVLIVVNPEAPQKDPQKADTAVGAAPERPSTGPESDPDPNRSSEAVAADAGPEPEPEPEVEPEVKPKAEAVAEAEVDREPQPTEAAEPEPPRGAEAHEPEPRAESREEPRRGDGLSQAEAARRAIRQLFELAKLDLEATVEEGEEGLLEVEVSGPDQDILLRDRGRMLLACQHLLPRMIRGLTGEASPCRVDSDNFHEVRAERLRVLAQRVAGEVREEGRSQTLEPMAPDERRIVHMTLTDDVHVRTESKGQGLFKRIVVSPAGREREREPDREGRRPRRPRGFDPYSRDR